MAMAAVSTEVRMQRFQALAQAMKKEETEEESQEGDDEQSSVFLQAFCAGAEKYTDGNFEGAIVDFTEALRLDDGSVQAWWQRASAKASLGMLVEAEDDFAEALLRACSDEELAGIHFSRGSARSDGGDEARGVADFGEALRLQPTRLEAWCCRGTALLAQGDPFSASQDAMSALKLDSECAAAWGLLGAARRAQGRLDEAIRSCQAALQLEPELTWAQDCLQAAQAEQAEQEPAGETETSEASDSRQNGNGPADGEERQRCDAGEQPQPLQLRRPQRLEKANKPRLLRDEGNELFRSGKLKEAALRYQCACEVREEGWQLAASNLAICHLKLGEHALAVDACNLALDVSQVSEQDSGIDFGQSRQRRYKALLTKFKAQAAQGEWLKAFRTLRELRANRDEEGNSAALPADVASAVDQEEHSWRQEHQKQLQLQHQSADAIPKLDHLFRAVCRMLPPDQTAANILDVIVQGGVEYSLEELDLQVLAEGQPAALAAGATVRFVAPGPEVAEPREEERQGFRVLRLQGTYHRVVPTVGPPPELVLLCGANLARDLDSWLPILHCLIDADVLTVVAGLRDESVIQNEDVLLALGCHVVPETLISSKSAWRDGCALGDSESQECEPCEGNVSFVQDGALVAFRGGTPTGLIDNAEALRQVLELRGFKLTVP
mmetsp:Transcript_100400/g.181209  ORF Transcript_100400/g.181209 Transcript_100400/m.181209 type:complete len:667 (+) Transcript_100400:58-2058(+)